MATRYYVDGINGSNANDGLSTGTAWQTIAHAIANVASWGQIIVRGNTTYALVGTTISTLGVKISGAASDWSLDGTKVVCTISSSDAFYGLATTAECAVENLSITLTDPLVLGIFDSSSSSPNVEIGNCILHGSSSQHLVKASPGGCNYKFRGCDIEIGTSTDNASANRSGTQFFNCRVKDMNWNETGNAATGNAYSSIFINCTIGRSLYYRQDLENCILDGCTYSVSDRTTGANAARISNCVIMNSPGYGIATLMTTAEAALILQNVCFYSNTSGDLDPNIDWEGTNVFNADPKFTDAANGDYTLQSDSPLIDAGYAAIVQNIGPTTGNQSGGGGSPVTVAHAF